jgi:hypothetical protein
MELYSQILDHGGSSFGIILRHIRDNPEEGCIIHCTAGKDRTGIIAAILLKVKRCYFVIVFVISHPHINVNSWPVWTTRRFPMNMR